MSEYIQEAVQLPNGLDDLGFRVSLRRFPSESLAAYRQRILLEVRQPAGASQEDFIRSAGRQVGLLDKPVFEIHLAVDGNGVPLAEDPRIDITPVRLIAYSNYDEGEIDFKVDFASRSDGYFLKHIEDAFSGSSLFTCNVLLKPGEWEYLKSNKLRYGSTERETASELLRVSRSNRLTHRYVKLFSGQAFNLFQNEVESLSELEEPGDYFIDYHGGVVFTYDSGSGFVSYIYRDFPHTIFYQPVRSVPYAHSDMISLTKNVMISDVTGLPEPSLLNSFGAELANRTLSVNPLGWGK